MLKRSLTLAGHKTSLALEAQFWDALEDMAQQRATTIPLLIGEIDTNRNTQNLSSAVRLAVLSHYRGRARQADQLKSGNN